MKVQSVYTSKIIKKGLKFACDNSALFAASTAFAFSVVARPIAILATPKTEEENKKYAIAKSLASSLVGYALMLCASKPVAAAVENINLNPEKFLKPATIESLKGTQESLATSKEYNFATQLLKLGLGAVIAVPKSIFTSALIPPFMKKMFPKKEDNNSNKNNNIENNKKLPFTGSPKDALSKMLARIIDSDCTINMSKKFSNTKFEQHMMNFTDTIATAAFIYQTRKNKKIEDKRKNALIYNSVISTGLSITGGYALNKLIDEPMKRFVEKFKLINMNDPDLHKYLKGINVARPALLLGGIYYILIPVISTFASDKMAKKENNN